MDLCLTLAEQSLEELQRKIEAYCGRVRYIEVRLDYLSKAGLPAVPGDHETEFIATCRPVREGGRYQGGEQQRLDVLRRAAQGGFSYVDVEADVREDLGLPSSARIVRSSHEFHDFPADLASRIQDLQRAGGDVFKLAVSISTTRQLVTLLRFMESLPAETPYLVLGLGDLGQPSRLLGAFLGNRWTYVAEKRELSAAPGQPSLQEALDWYRLPSWKKVPSIYGVMGNPVAHSLSPLIHNRLFQYYELDRVYFPFPLDDVGVWLEYISTSRFSFRGFSITLPFKTDVLKFVQVRHSSVDSLNTLIRRENCWEGTNTDYPSFLKPLKDSVPLKGQTAVVLGNGGVANTVVRALQDEGARVTAVGRSSEKISRFASRYGCRYALFSDLPFAADICVNTTPVGQYPHIEESPLREDQLLFGVVYDLVYHPEKTRLLQLAEKKRLKTISGMEMFVEQAALQFVEWTGIAPDREMMKEVVRSALES